MLCRVLYSAKNCTRQRVALPSAAACPALGKARHSANALFAERNTRQRAHSAKCPSVARLPRPRRYHLKKNVYRALNLTLGEEALCRVLRPGTRQSIFVFFEFWFQFFFVDLIYCLQAHVKIWDLFITFCYISWINFVYLHFFRKSKFELQVHEIMKCSHSKNDSHVVECILRPYAGTHPKFWTPCSPNMTTRLWSECI